MTSEVALLPFYTDGQLVNQPLAHFAGGCLFNRGLIISAQITPGIWNAKKPTKDV
jgi:hypothetical protein